tara:strand:+ start:64961 stop:66199 length:1239 start_codon:yes stop_codon:yes gene_type:complete
MSTFDDRRAAAWSDSNGSVDIGSEDYGVAIAGVTTNQPGATVAVLGVDPLALGVIKYDEFGSLEQFGANIDLPNGVILNSTPSLVAAPDLVGDVRGLVAIGGLGGADSILFYDVGNGAPVALGSVSGSDCGLAGDNLGHRMVFRETGEDGLFDLIALRDDEIFIISDLDPTASSHTCTRCTLDGVGSDVVVAEFGEDPDPAPDPPEFEGEEVIVSIEGTITGFSAARLKAANGECPQGSAVFTDIGGPETDYGTRMAVGGGADDGSFHIALTAPSTNSVYVLENFDRSNPAATPQKLQAPEGSVAFGSGGVLFVDLDTNDGDELVVGDPEASAEGVFNAGQVSVFEFSDDDGFSPRDVLYDSDPEVGQNYGRAISETEFVFAEDDADILVVTGLNETFTLFQSLSSGVDPRK